MEELNLSRRHFFKLGTGFVGTTTLASVLGLDLLNSPPAKAEITITPDDAFAELMEGNKRFVEHQAKNPHRSVERLAQVAKGQSPFAAAINCSDSRVPTELIFDCGFGDIFVVRNAGNVVTPEEIGSLEFGTLILGAKVLMVMGHQNCGAVKATLKGQGVPGSISSVVEKIEPAVKQYKGLQNDKQAFKEAVEANVRFQLNKLKSSVIINDLVREGKLKVVGGYYDLDTGAVSIVS
jgi:carbonic anhydrase